MALPAPSGTVPTLGPVEDIGTSDKAERFATVSCEQSSTLDIDPIHISPKGDKPVDDYAKDQGRRKDMVEVRYRHMNGEHKWFFPIESCLSWKSFKGMLCQACSVNAYLLHDIENERLQIIDDDGATIVPAVWEAFVRVPWKVEAMFFSQQSPNELHQPPELSPPIAQAESNEISIMEEKEQSYNTSVMHKVAYYYRNHASDPFHTLLYEKECDGSIVAEIDTIERRASALPVLEEILKVTRAGETTTPERDPGYQSKSAVIRPDDDTKVSLAIRSPHLLDALRAVIKYTIEHPDNALDGLTNKTFIHPFVDLYHNIGELLEYKNSSNETKLRHSSLKNAETDCHIQILIDYLYAQKRINLRLAEERWSRKTPMTTFASFWLLLKPGTDVYTRVDGVYRAWVIESFEGGPTLVSYRSKAINLRPFSSAQETAEEYKVIMWGLKIGEDGLVKERHEVKIEQFDGEREIAAMPVFPCRFQESEKGASLRDKLVQRGKHYITLIREPYYGEYTGKGSSGKTYVRARVVVDRAPKDENPHPVPLEPFLPPPPIANIKHPIGSGARVPGCRCDICRTFLERGEGFTRPTFDSYNHITSAQYDHMTDHQFFLCDAYYTAFVLKEREYDTLEVNKITKTHNQRNAIDRLVLKDGTLKTTLKAICQASAIEHGSYEKPFYADFIRGKGEGHILLLHGPPGCGKTFTAESFAEFQGRPLLSITAADLGHEPQELERNLLTFFHDASRWGAIVLLDEADIYLEKRETHDLLRNSVVSVFLRAFDYFQGILFLTTNRVGSFDEAFISRIHLQIGYDPLSDDGRRKVWSNHFQKLGEDYEKGGRQIVYDYDAKEYVTHSSEVRDLKWNGREIRNAFQTAVSLAIYDTPQDQKVPVKLQEHHLQQVVRMSAAFRKYMKSTHNNETSEDRAFRAGLRDDQFSHG